MRPPIPPRFRCRIARAEGNNAGSAGEGNAKLSAPEPAERERGAHLQHRGVWGRYKFRRMSPLSRLAGEGPGGREGQRINRIRLQP